MRATSKNEKTAREIINMFAEKNYIPWHQFDWKELKRQSVIMNLPVHKIFDANYVGGDTI